MCTDKNKKRWLFILALYWVVFNYGVLHAPIDIFSAPGGIAPVQNVQAYKTDIESPEGLASLKSFAVTLPDDWYHSEHQVRQIWYRASIELEPDDAHVWAVYLPSVTHNAEVFINDIWVGQGGHFIDPVSRHHNEPLLFDFSSALLRESENIIDIRVKASYPTQGLMDQFYIAPRNKLIEAYQWKHFLRFDFIAWVSLGMYLTGLIIFIFWLVRPQDQVYALFSLQLFIWATHNLNLFIADIPTSAHFWEAMTMSTLGWTVVAMIFFNHRYVGLQDANKSAAIIERAAVIFALMGMGIFFLPDIGLILKLGYGVWDSFLIVFGSYAIIFLIREFWQRPRTEVLGMILVGIPILVFGLHDILTVNYFRDRREGLTIQFGIIPAIFLFSWFMIRRFTDSITQAEELAATLELRVAEKQQALALKYEQLKALEQQQLLSEERERIMRDMHDGIGGQLVSVVVMLKNYSDGVMNQVREKVQLSLVDLRFVIDSLDPVLNDLPTLLGMMRSRLADQLRAANINLEWAVTELPELSELSPRRSLHIMRIVQEATTNAIKYSCSDSMRVSTGIIEDSIFIEITDFGKGLPQDNPALGTGRGIENMKYRAAQIGGTLEIESNSNGTCVRLELPVS